MKQQHLFDSPGDKHDYISELPEDLILKVDSWDALHRVLGLGLGLSFLVNSRHIKPLLLFSTRAFSLRAMCMIYDIPFTGKVDRWLIVTADLEASGCLASRPLDRAGDHPAEFSISHP